MKAIVSVIAGIVLLMAGTANADYSLYLGGTYPTGIQITEGETSTTPVSTSGGPISPSTLNGAPLEYVYCIDLYRDVIVADAYNNTLVTNNGVIYGGTSSQVTVNNAAQIAWLLTNYGTTTDPNAQIALQVAIWHEEYLNSPGQYVNLASNAPSAQVADYNGYLNALGSNTGNVGSFYWITPADSNGQYQAEIAPNPSVTGSETPIPGAAWLLGSGLFWLTAFRKRFIG